MASWMHDEGRFHFEAATPQDRPELLEILEGAGFKGNIALCYTRRPDAYQSFKKEGPQVDLVVCRDREQGRIVGFGACAIRKLWVNGRAENVGYLFGLRMRPEYFKKYPLLHRGYAFLRNCHGAQEVRLYITTILAENQDTQKLLEKPRSFMPTYTPHGNYEIYALKTRKVPPTSSFAALHFRQATPADMSALVQFSNENGRSYQFFPVIAEDDLRASNLCGLTIADFYLLCGARAEILAAGAVWDQRSYKQYLLQGYQGLLKLLWPLSRLFPLFGFPALPAPGSLLNFFTLSFWAVNGNQPELFSYFLNQIAALPGAYPFFLVGLHEKHPFRKILQRRPHISYKSKLYLVSWNEQQEYVDKLEQNMVPYLECGML